MKAVLSWLWEKILKLAIWFIDTIFTPLRWVVDAILWVISQLVYYAFDGFLSAIHIFFTSIDFSAVIFSNSIGSDFHPLFVWFIVRLGLPQCFTLLVSALTVRLLLNLIPASVTRI